MFAEACDDPLDVRGAAPCVSDPQLVVLEKRVGVELGDGFVAGLLKFHLEIDEDGPELVHEVVMYCIAKGVIGRVRFILLVFVGNAIVLRQ